MKDGAQFLTREPGPLSLRIDTGHDSVFASSLFEIVLISLSLWERGGERVVRSSKTLPLFPLPKAKGMKRQNRTGDARGAV
jgi:hypothetical protein